MLQGKETEIPPPKSPLTAKINIAIMDYYFPRWAAKHLPVYDVEVTSGYRTREHNEKVGGAANSAHLHGLAKDFVVKRKGDGKQLTGEELRNLYYEFVEPHWPGYSYASDRHVHVNLSREITLYAGMAGVAAAGIVAAKLFFGRENDAEV